MEISFKSQRMKLNVGGVTFETLRRTLQKIQKGRLWKISIALNEYDLHELCDDFNLKECEFFFDRDPTLFMFILNYYRVGRLHINESLCPVDLNNELIYWDLDQPLMDVCCEEKLYNKEKEVDMNFAAYTKILNEIRMQKMQEEKDKSNEFKLYKKQIWNIVDDSFGTDSSSIAKVFGATSIIFILLSTSILLLGSMPFVKISELPHDFQLNNETNVTNQFDTSQFDIISYLRFLENSCVVWFTFEYGIRLISSPNLSKFMRDFLNFIDILCILPFYFGLFLNKFPFFLKIRHLMQMLRVLRLLKLGRYSDGIKSFTHALKASSKPLSYLILLLAFNVLVFSSIMYFAENEDPDSQFTSILASCWWNIITTTTVGYGDMIPKTAFGQIIASMSSVLGIIMLALPLGILANNFGAYEKYSNRREKALKVFEESGETEF